MASDFLGSSARSSALQQRYDAVPNSRLAIGNPSSRSAIDAEQASPKPQWLAEKDQMALNGESTTHTRSAPSKLDLLLNWLLQIFGITIAVLFGVFSILSYYAANSANQSAVESLKAAQAANQVALLALCLQNVSANIEGPIAR